jgi:hypothetical protein
MHLNHEPQRSHGFISYTTYNVVTILALAAAAAIYLQKNPASLERLSNKLDHPVTTKDLCVIIGCIAVGRMLQRGHSLLWDTFVARRHETSLSAIASDCARSPLPHTGQGGTTKHTTGGA